MESVKAKYTGVLYFDTWDSFQVYKKNLILFTIFLFSYLHKAFQMIEITKLTF